MSVDPATLIRRGIALARASREGDAQRLGLTLLALAIAFATPGITATTFIRPHIANVLYHVLVGAVLALGARRAARHAAGGAGRPQCGAA